MAKGGKRAGAGRPKGSTNQQQTGELRTMILDALGKAGGIEYLEARAKDQPTAFMSLLGRVLPLAHAGADGEGPVELVYKWREQSKSTQVTSPAASSSHTMNGSNGSALGSPTDGAGKPSPTSRN